jgi:hypothetical protein
MQHTVASWASLPLFEATEGSFESILRPEIVETIFEFLDRDPGKIAKLVALRSRAIVGRLARTHPDCVTDALWWHLNIGSGHNAGLLCCSTYSSTDAYWHDGDSICFNVAKSCVANASTDLCRRLCIYAVSNCRHLSSDGHSSHMVSTLMSLSVEADSTNDGSRMVEACIDGLRIIVGRFPIHVDRILDRYPIYHKLDRILRDPASDRARTEALVRKFMTPGGCDVWIETCDYAIADWMSFASWIDRAIELARSGHSQQATRIVQLGVHVHLQWCGRIGEDGKRKNSWLTTDVLAMLDGKIETSALPYRMRDELTLRLPWMFHNKDATANTKEMILVVDDFMDIVRMLIRCPDEVARVQQQINTIVCLGAQVRKRKRSDLDGHGCL